MLGIYIHIPFCLSKCPYCDFYSLPYREELAQQYVQAAVRAVQTAPAAGQAVESVYFGGGTPVLFGYSCDLPRITRFNTSLNLMERPGTLICFDFQADVLRRYCGGRVRFQTIDFTKFEGRLFP